MRKYLISALAFTLAVIMLIPSVLPAMSEGAERGEASWEYTFESCEVTDEKGDTVELDLNTPDAFFVQMALNKLWQCGLAVDGDFQTKSQTALINSAAETGTPDEGAEFESVDPAKVIYYGLQIKTPEYHESAGIISDINAEPETTDYTVFTKITEKTKNLTLKVNTTRYIDGDSEYLVYWFHLTNKKKTINRYYKLVGKKTTVPVMILIDDEAVAALSLTINGITADETMNDPVEVAPDESLTLEYEATGGADGKLSLHIMSENPYSDKLEDTRGNKEYTYDDLLEIGVEPGAEYIIMLALEGGGEDVGNTQVSGKFILKNKEAPTATASATPTATASATPTATASATPTATASATPTATASATPTATASATPTATLSAPKADRNKVTIVSNMRESEQEELTFAIQSQKTEDGGDNKMVSYVLKNGVDEAERLTVLNKDGEQIGEVSCEASKDNEGVVTVVFTPNGDHFGEGEVTLTGIDANGMSCDVSVNISVTPETVGVPQITVNGTPFAAPDYGIDNSADGVTVGWKTSGDVKECVYRFDTQQAEENWISPETEYEYTIDKSKLDIGERYVFEVKATGYDGESETSKVQFYIKSAPPTDVLLKMSEGDTYETDTEEEVAVAKGGWAEFGFAVEGDVKNYNLIVKDDEGNEIYIFPDETESVGDDQPEIFDFWYNSHLSADELELDHVYTATLTAVGYDGTEASAERKFYLEPDEITDQKIYVSGEDVTGKTIELLETDDASYELKAKGDVSSYLAAWEINGEADHEGEIERAGEIPIVKRIEFDKEYKVIITFKAYHGGEDKTAEVTIRKKALPIEYFTATLDAERDKKNPELFILPAQGEREVVFSNDGDIDPGRDIAVNDPAGIAIEADGKWYINTADMKRGTVYTLTFTAYGRDGGSKEAPLNVRLEYYGVLPGLRNMHPAAFVLLLLLLTGGFVTLLVLLVRKPGKVTTDDIFSGESIRSIRSGDDYTSLGERTLRK